MGKKVDNEYTLPTPIEALDASALRALQDMRAQAITPEALEKEAGEVEKVRQGTSVDLVELAATKGDFIVGIWKIANESGQRQDWMSVRIFPRPQSAIGRARLFMVEPAQSLKIGGSYYWDKKGTPFCINNSDKGLNGSHEKRARKLQELWDAGDRNDQQTILRLATMPRGDIITPVIDRFMQK